MKASISKLPWGFCPGNGRRPCPWHASQRGGGVCPRCTAIPNAPHRALLDLRATLDSQPKPAELRAALGRYRKAVAKPLNRSRR